MSLFERDRVHSPNLLTIRTLTSGNKAYLCSLNRRLMRGLIKINGRDYRERPPLSLSVSLSFINLALPGHAGVIFVCAVLVVLRV